jgi:hypothetical protein
MVRFTPGVFEKYSGKMAPLPYNVVVLCLPDFAFGAPLLFPAGLAEVFYRKISGAARTVQVLGLGDQRNVTFGGDLGGRVVLTCRLGMPVVADVLQCVIRGRRRRL